MEGEGQTTSSNMSTLFDVDTKFCSDSVEWCPHEGEKNIFTCANYQLEPKDSEGSNERFGRILLFSLTPKDGVKLLQSIKTAAILDQKWCQKQINGASILGVVNAESTIEIYQLDGLCLRLLCFHSFNTQNDKNKNLILSLDWSMGISSNTETYVVCSDSQGEVHLLQFTKDELICKSSWKSHTFEAWIAAFYYWDPNIFFSGGDDSLFILHDSRVRQCLSKNKSHEAGVTSMHSNCSKEHYLVTGSYDERIRFWDVRHLKNETFTLKMPGPLWRLKWDPCSQRYLLAACMAGGVHVIDDVPEKKDIVGSYCEHKSLAYGADWSHLTESDDCAFINDTGQFVLGTCSFYDHLLCVSKIFL